MLLVQYSPPRRGGVARQRRGGQFGNNVVCRSDHPVCAFALLGASSPPLRGGEYPSSAAAQFIQDLFGLAHVQVFVELTVDLGHQQHWNQCRSLSGVEREQLVELVLRFFREHLPFPLERPFFPGVNVAGEDNCNKQQHLEESKELQFAVHDGPGEKKHGLNIEEKEQHGDEIELNGETLACGTDRTHSTFVGRELSGCRFLLATGLREEQRDGAESSDKNEENQNWHPAFEHASGLPRRANSVDYARNDSNF